LEIKKFGIEGMSCSACSSSVERVVRRLDGVVKADVNLLGKFMICEYDASKVDDEKIISAVKKAGFEATLSSAEKEKKERKSGDGGFTDIGTRLAVSVVFLLILMFFSMGHMVGIHVFPEEGGAALSALTQLLLALPILYVNRKFFFVGFRALIKHSPNMDTLVAVGSASAIIYGIFSTYMICYGMGFGDGELVAKYAHNLYFESGAMILSLVTVGKYLEERSKTKTKSAIASLVKLAPETATVIKNGKNVTVKVGDIAVGDLILIKPGERIPVDGVIVEGASYVDQSALTGESVPVEKTVGDSVMSASSNKNGRIVFRAEKVGGDTTLSRIIELIENAGASKAPVSKLADRIAAVFVPSVMAISLVTAVAWLIAGYGFEHALNCAASVLVISCPCALGLATPVAITVAAGRCASKGIMIKSAEAFEILSKCDTVVLDKTGTVTSGVPVVTDIIPINKDESDFLKIAASLEKPSEHPLSDAVVSAYDGELFEADDFFAVFGKGVRATIGGVLYFGGSPSYISELGIDIEPYRKAIEELSSGGKTVMMFSSEKSPIGIIATADEPRATSADAVHSFKALGAETIMLTGDNERCAKAISGRVGIDKVIADLLPEDKEKAVASLRAEGKKVLMVGDGINDAPALVSADMGIAVSSGTDVAIDSADVVLMQNDLRLAAEAMSFSRKTLRVIKGNLFWAFIYNVIGIPLAAGVLFPTLGILLSPMIGAAAMSFSSIFVVTNSLRLYKK